MKKTFLILFVAVLGTATITSCTKENKHPVKGTWKVVDASVTSDFIKREECLGNIYTFTDNEMIYRANEFSEDSSVSQFKYIDKKSFESYNVQWDIRSNYTFEFIGEGKKKQLIMNSGNGFIFTMEKMKK